MDAQTTEPPRSISLLLPFVLPALGFVIPFVVAGPQILTGSAVNMLLALFALRYPKRSALAICALPSAGAVLHGLLFGSYTPHLVYLMPFIWVGNYVWITGIRMLRSTHPAVIVGVSALAKSAFLLAVTALLVGLSVIPNMFLTAMGLLQLVTAIIGGILALAVLRLSKTSYG